MKMPHHDTTQINDKWLRIFGIPLAALNSHYLYTDLLNEDKLGFAIIYLVAVLEVGLIWETNRVLIKKARRKYPEIHQTRRRILYELVWCSLVSLGLQVVYLWLHKQSPDWQVNFTTSEYIANFTASIFALAIVVILYEVVYFYRKWRENMVENAELRKEQVERQLEVLKSQINPHFLFNSLNTLSSLIQIDPQKADTFLEELATVYRYLLRKNSAELCILEDEVNFIKAYFHLLKTRYGESIQLQICVAEAMFRHQIPPLTLQLLVENAVKHNVVSAEKPLIVKIYSQSNELSKYQTTNTKLIIENNLQQKKNTIPSTQIGLNNILTKYQLLGFNSVEITQTADTFRVVLPLISE
jgi:two-component system, LytTR family, sensor kinase